MIRGVLLLLFFALSTAACAAAEQPAAVIEKGDALTMEVFRSPT